MGPARNTVLRGGMASYNLDPGSPILQLANVRLADARGNRAAWHALCIRREAYALEPT